MLQAIIANAKKKFVAVMGVKLRHHGRKSSTVASVLTAFRFVEGATESVTEAVEIYIYIVKLSFATLEQCTRCNFSET